MSNFKTYFNFWLFVALYSEKGIALYFTLQFLGVLHIVEENKGHVWNPVEILSHEGVLLMQKC